MSISNDPPRLFGMYSKEEQDFFLDKSTPQVGFTNSKGEFVKVFTVGTRFLKNESRLQAGAVLLSAPLWIPLKSIVSIGTSILNIASGGSISTQRGLIEGGPLSRLRSMGSSALSIVTTPLNVLVEIVATISHLIKPKPNIIDMLAAHLWTGGVALQLTERPVGQEQMEFENYEEEQEAQPPQVTSPAVTESQPALPSDQKAVEEFQQHLPEFFQNLPKIYPDSSRRKALLDDIEEALRTESPLSFQVDYERPGIECTITETDSNRSFQGLTEFTKEEKDLLKKGLETAAYKNHYDFHEQRINSRFSKQESNWALIVKTMVSQAPFNGLFYAIHAAFQTYPHTNVITEKGTRRVDISTLKNRHARVSIIRDKKHTIKGVRIQVDGVSTVELKSVTDETVRAMGSFTPSMSFTVTLGKGNTASISDLHYECPYIPL